MQAKQVAALGDNLRRFLGRFSACFRTRNARAHLVTYVEGQLGPLERKSVEPIAYAAGVEPRNLLQFLSVLHWDEDEVRDQVQRIVAEDHRGEECLAIIDETSFAKKGTETACVQRQYCGATGKVDNCVVSVHLAFAAGDFHTLIDSTLYLPKETWDDKPGRRRKVGVPDDVVYQPLHEIALDQLEHAVENGVPIDYVLADERYGGVPEFLETLEGWDLRYVLEVPKTLSGWTRRPAVEEIRVEGPGPKSAVRPILRLLPDADLPRGAAHWAEYGRIFRKTPWVAYRIKDTFKGPEVWEAKECPFFQHRKGRVSPSLRLILARNVLDGTVKYFVSNAPDSVPLTTLLRIAFGRWHVERCFEDSKGEVGMDHFEVRRYGSIKRHLMLTMVSHLFLAEQTVRLRGEKDGRDRLSGEAGGRHPVGHARSHARK